MHALPSSLSASLLALLALAPPAEGWLGVRFDPEREEAVVAEVTPDWPAAKAGVQPGDVLVAVGDKQTPTREDFIAAIKAAKSGEDLTIKLRRGAEEKSVTVRLIDKRPPEAGSSGPQATRKPEQAPVVEDGKASPGKAAAGAAGYLGITVDADDDEVVVGEVIDGSPAAAAKLRRGDVIVSIGGHRVDDFGDLDAAMRKTKPGQKVPVELRSDEGTRSVMVTIGERPADIDEAAAPKAAGPRRPATAPRTAAPARPRADNDVEAELQALRKELAEVKKLLEELRSEQKKGRE